MKNIMLTALALIMMGVGQCVAQGKKYSITRIIYQSNDDVEVALKRKKAEIDNNKSLIPVQRVLAKKIASAKIKNAYEKAAETQYVYGFCNGEFTNYSYWDIDANRSVVLCPQMGRISINDWTKRKSIVAFPRLKMAMVLDITQEQIDAAAKTSGDVKSMWTSKPLYDFQEVTEINGFPVCQNYALVPIQDGRETTGQTGIVDGVKVELYPLPGHLLMKNDNEYYIGVYVDGETNSPTANFSLELLDVGDCPISEANFVLPNGYKIFMDYKSLNKAMKKGVKDNKHVLPDPGKMPEVVW